MNNTNKQNPDHNKDNDKDNDCGNNVCDGNHDNEGISNEVPNKENNNKGDSIISLFDSRYQRIWEFTEPFVLSYPGHWSHFDMSPWGKKIQEAHRFSCLQLKNSIFYDLLHKLDGISFGPKGMPMDKWVFFDCGEMPGAIVGLGLSLNPDDFYREEKTGNKMSKRTLTPDLIQKVRDIFHVPDHYRGMVPISMYIAIPMVSEGYWFGHNLSSANEVFGGDFSGLGILTKALGIQVMKIKTLLGATQWGSHALHIHLQLADMHLESAYTPAHTFPHTMTYRSYYSTESLISALKGHPRRATYWDYLHPSDDEKFSTEIQYRIERGEKFKICGRPEILAGKVFYPVVIESKETNRTNHQNEDNRERLGP